uniref:Galanin-like peptide n=1 Tax=Sus scrofa TaxID=9823 RepID=A0A8D1K189_PIG
MRTTSSQTWGMTASLSVSLSLGLSFSVQGRGGWTLNSAGYLLGPVLHPPSRAEGGGKGKTALGILDLWKAIDGLPYPQSQLASKRSLGETFAKPDSGDLGKLCKNVPKEKDALPSYMPPNFRSKLPPRPQILLKP